MSESRGSRQATASRLFSALLVVSVGMIALHNLLDGVTPAQLGPFAWLWQILHVRSLLSTSPLVPVAATGG